MHYHIPKPFFRKSRKTWYVQISGRQVSLGQDRTEAFRRYYEIMANPPEKRLESVDRGDGLKLCQFFDSFLDWLEKNRSEGTYGWYQHRLQRFADFYPDLTVSQLKPFHVQEWADTYKDHAKTTTRNYLRSVKRCLKWALKQGYIDRDPIAGMEVPAGEARDVFVPKQQFEFLLSLTPDQNLRDLSGSMLGRKNASALSLSASPEFRFRNNRYRIERQDYFWFDLLAYNASVTVQDYSVEPPSH